jgi:two-component system, OmpR family, response regulator QseB
VSRILVVEDDSGIRGMLERGLRLAGHDPTLAADLEGGRDAWTRAAFDLVLLDVMLPDGDGIDLLAERRARGDSTPTVLITAREEAELRDRANVAGASAVLPKPFSYADLVSCIERLV